MASSRIIKLFLHEFIHQKLGILLALDLLVIIAILVPRSRLGLVENYADAISLDLLLVVVVGDRFQTDVQ